MSILGVYRGHAVVITDSDQIDGQQTKQVRVETVNGEALWHYDFWVGGEGPRHKWVDWSWVDLKDVHNIHLSDAVSISDYIIAASELV